MKGKLTIYYNVVQLACAKHEYVNIFSAPKPECTSDPECPIHLACIQEKCQDPCFTAKCGINADCKASNHRAVCVCRVGYVGDPYNICEERKISTQFEIQRFFVQCKLF